MQANEENVEAGVARLSREKAMEKIRKLLAMANDGRGNENEAAAAARQAEKMMRAWQVSAADVVLKELEQDEAFDRGLADAYFGPRDPRHVPAGASGWVGVTAIGVGRLCTCKVDLVDTKDGVKVRFSGYSMDVALAQWLYHYLCTTVYRLSKQHYAGRGQAAAKAFRSGAANELQRRMFLMVEERARDNRAAGQGSTALVIYDRKQQRVDEMFGAQSTRKTRSTASDRAAYAHGREEGSRVAIHTNRPIEGTGRQAAIGAQRRLTN